MGRRIQRIKSLSKRLLNYMVMRARSDDYYDHELWAKVKFETYMWWNLKFKKETKFTLFQQIRSTDKIVGPKGRMCLPQDVLMYPNRSQFLRYSGKNVVAVYTLRKKSDKLGFLYSEHAEPLRVKDLR